VIILEKSFIFDSIANDRQYVSQDFADYYKAFFSSGVLAVLTNLEVVQGANTFDVKLKAGKAVIEGRYYENTSDMTLSVATTATTRVDRLVLRCDTQSANRSIKAFIVQGTTTQPPALTRTSAVYEISLAKISVTTTSLTIVDERADNSVCGISGITDVRLAQAISATTGTFGTATFNDIMGQTDTLVKSIPIGSGKRNGKALIYCSDYNTYGILVFFYADKFQTKVVDVSGRSHSTSITSYGIVSGASAFATGIDDCQILEVYINGSNIDIKFRRTDVQHYSRNLKCTIEWEVY